MATTTSSQEYAQEYDVIVVGGGNAALWAAISARRVAPRVLVLERAPKHMRGGNTRHTRDIRCAHESADNYFSGPYSEEEFLNDLIGVTGGPANLDLTKLVVRGSVDLPKRMTELGVRWQAALTGTLHLSRTNLFFLGGGKAALNTYYSVAQRMGITICYDALVEDLIIENGRFEAVALRTPSGQHFIRGRAAVIAAGGFEANLEWHKRNWGEASDNFIVRGSPFNDGLLLAKLLQKGAKPIGDPKAFHAIAVDARAPKYDGGIVTRLDAIPFGIVINRDARRFYDEGEDIWPKRYAIWGTLIAKQPGQMAYSIVDSKVIDNFLPPMFKPYQSDTLTGLAGALGLDPKVLVETVDDFNRGCAGNTSVRTAGLDGMRAQGVDPPKSNWALPLDCPPFYGLPLRPGITFTYMGVTVDEIGRIVNQQDQSYENLYAAGEIMSGNILTKGYLGGFGLTIGAVSGELAGRHAATYGRS